MKTYIFQRDTSPYVINLVKEIKLIDGLEVVADPELADVIFCLQFGNDNAALALQEYYPDKPFITYIWDLYASTLFDTRGYNWEGFEKVCRNSEHCITVAEGQRQRALDIYELEEDKITVVKRYAELFDYDDIQDKDYIYQPLRWYPFDPQNNWLQVAAGILQLPFSVTDRGQGSELPLTKYKDVLANSSFLVSPYWEHSTGGLSCIQAYNLGKPILYSATEYNAGHEYLGERAIYFSPSFDEFAVTVKELWDNRPKLDLADCQAFCQDNYSISVMAKNLVRELKEFA